MTHVATGEFLAVFFVAEPGPEADPLEELEQNRAVGDARFDFFPELHRGCLDRAFEGEHGFAFLRPHAQRGSARAQEALAGIHQRVLLQATAAARADARGGNRRARGGDRVKPQLDLALER